MNRDIAERFQRDTATHRMTVLHDDGLYRHLRFQRVVTSKETGRRSTSSNYWFDLITWPGTLTITGDCGSFVFSRVTDMFEFFRGSQINPQYWAEKVRAEDRSGVRAYSPELFRQMVTEDAKEAEGEFPGVAEAVTKAFFGELGDEWDTQFEHGAREALRDFSYRPVGKKEPFTFADAWEWDLDDYHWQFLWCCHAIQWGVSQYDSQRAAV